MPFEVFDKDMAADEGQVFLSIQKGGIVALNRAAYGVLGRPAAVELLYDRDRSLVGVRRADPSARTAQLIRPSSNKTAYLVSGRRFTSHCGIPVDRARRWPARMENGILFVDVSQEPEG